jgi:DNA polymerase (family 10)
MLTLPGAETDILIRGKEDPPVVLSNDQIAQRLQRQATELARGRTNLYRARAFRQAAMTVLALPVELSVLVAANGRQALEELPGVGRSLAKTIAAYLNAN